MSQIKQFQLRIQGADGVRIERLERDGLVIGRSVQADIVISNAEVSRKHVTLRLANGKLQIVDEDSKNGTFIDNHRIPAHKPHVLMPGQILKLGLAPEKISVEEVEAVAAGEEPPPVQSVVQRSPQTRSQVRIEAPVKMRAPLQRSVESEAPVGRQEPAVRPESRRVEERQVLSETALHEAQEHAKHLIDRAKKEAESILAAAERSKRSAEEDLGLLRGEKSRLEEQLKDIKAETEKRLDDQKRMARESAEGKLRLQDLQQEIHRSEMARTQLASELAQEIEKLEAQREALRADLEADSKARQSQVQKEAKEILDRAKKQAEILTHEAEMKAKTVREKVQSDVANQKRQAELDLAELKLRQVSEIKSLQEKEESEWRVDRQRVAQQFVRDLRGRVEQLVYGAQLEPNFKIRFLTAIEEMVHQHWTKDMAASSAPATDFSDELTPSGLKPGPLLEESGSGKFDLGRSLKEEEVPKDLPPPPPARWRQGLGVMAAFLVLVLGFWAMRRGLPFFQSSPREIASSGQSGARVKLETKSAPSAADSAAAAPAPVAQVPSPAQPVATAPGANPPSGTPPPVTAEPPPVLPSPIATKPVSWRDLTDNQLQKKWQRELESFMRSQLKLSNQKVQPYRLAEQKFLRELGQLNRRPASVRERETNRLETKFARDAAKLIGQSNWQKVLGFRNSFVAKNR